MSPIATIIHKNKGKTTELFFFDPARDPQAHLLLEGHFVVVNGQAREVLRVQKARLSKSIGVANAEKKDKKGRLVYPGEFVEACLEDCEDRCV